MHVKAILRLVEVDDVLDGVGFLHDAYHLNAWLQLYELPVTW